MTHSREELALVEVEHEEAEDSGKDLNTFEDHCNINEVCIGRAI